jgi:hypothetical protein
MTLCYGDSVAVIWEAMWTDLAQGICSVNREGGSMRWRMAASVPRDVLRQIAMSWRLARGLPLFASGEKVIERGMDFMRVNSSLLRVGRSWVDDHRRESASGHMVREDSDRDRRAEQYRSVSVTAQGNAATQGDSNVRSFAGESAAVEPGMDFMRINVPPLSATGIWG